MNLTWGQKTLDCRHLQLKTGSIREGDIIVEPATGARVMVKSIARNCPHIENLSKIFTAALVVDANGKCSHQIIGGLYEVYRVRSK